MSKSAMEFCKAHGINLTETGGESRGGKKTAQAELTFPNGDKLFIKGYLSGAGVAKDVTADVEVFDSKKGKVTREKVVKSAPDRMDKLEAMLAQLLAAKA